MRPIPNSSDLHQNRFAGRSLCYIDDIAFASAVAVPVVAVTLIMIVVVVVTSAVQTID
jgi:hypothetical protein